MSHSNISVPRRNGNTSGMPESVHTEPLKSCDVRPLAIPSRMGIQTSSPVPYNDTKSLEGTDDEVWISRQLYSRWISRLLYPVSWASKRDLLGKPDYPITTKQSKKSEEKLLELCLWVKKKMATRGQVVEATETNSTLNSQQRSRLQKRTFKSFYSSFKRCL